MSHYSSRPIRYFSSDFGQVPFSLLLALVPLPAKSGLQHWLVSGRHVWEMGAHYNISGNIVIIKNTQGGNICSKQDTNITFCHAGRVPGRPLHQDSPAQSAGHRREAFFSTCLHQTVWVIYGRSMRDSHCLFGVLRHISESYETYVFMWPGLCWVFRQGFVSWVVKDTLD